MEEVSKNSQKTAPGCTHAAAGGVGGESASVELDISKHGIDCTTLQQCNSRPARELEQIWRRVEDTRTALTPSLWLGAVLLTNELL